MQMPMLYGVGLVVVLTPLLKETGPAMRAPAQVTANANP
jgi:hypothetical protein